MPGPQPLFPSPGDIGRQAQAVDTGVVAFQVPPEHVAQVRGQGSQAAVVQHRLPFSQVIHEQVTNRPAGQLVAVDEFLAGQLPAAAHLLQGRWRVRAQDAHAVQRAVERDGMSHRSPVRVGLGIEQIHDVTDGDLGDAASLGAQQDRGPVPRVSRRCGGQVGILIAGAPQPGEPLTVPGIGHGAGQRTPAGHRADEPVDAGANDIGADRDRQRRADRIERGVREWPALTVKPLRGNVAPVLARGISAAGQPAVLPGLARAAGQPASQSSSNTTPRRRCFWLPGLASTNGGLVRDSNTTSRSRYVAGQLATPARPVNRLAPIRRGDAKSSATPPHRLDRGRHGVTLPNSTCNVSGR